MDAMKIKSIVVENATEYFSLPKQKREKFGFYILPAHLPMDFFNEDDDGWNSFYKEIKKRYPIQYFFREVVGGGIRFYKNRISDIKYKIKCFFKPYHKEIRAKIPKEWRDISVLIEEVNLQFIVSFYEEAVESHVDWNSDDYHKNFFEWLTNSNNIIVKEIPNLKKEMDNELRKASEKRGKLSYQERYSKYDELENKIKEIKTKLIKEMVDYRDFFWT